MASTTTDAFNEKAPEGSGWFWRVLLTEIVVIAVVHTTPIGPLVSGLLEPLWEFTGMKSLFGVEWWNSVMGAHGHGAISEAAAHATDIPMGASGFQDCLTNGGLSHFHGDQFVCSPT